jgi:hypothetical protein
MNELQILKGLDPLLSEVGLSDSPPSDPAPPGDHPFFASDPIEPSPHFGSRVEDRRVAHRYRARDGRCWIGWHAAGGFRQSAAWIIDISASGGLLATDGPPPLDRSVWIRLDNPSVPDWAEARVVDLRPTSSEIHAVRLVFRGTCPYAVIKAVAFSSQAPQGRPEAPASWNLNAW